MKKNNEEKIKKMRTKSRVDFGINAFDQVGKIFGFINNLSSDGCFITLNKTVKEKKFFLSFETPHTLETIKSHCTPVWIDKEGLGLGLKFSMEVEDKNILDDFLFDFSK